MKHCIYIYIYMERERERGFSLEKVMDKLCCKDKYVHIVVASCYNHNNLRCPTYFLSVTIKSI